jgi:hypothetical protein
MGGLVARRPSSETGTRSGVKQKTEAERSDMVVEFNQLLPAMPDLGMGLPNVYISLLTLVGRNFGPNCILK